MTDLSEGHVAALDYLKQSDQDNNQAVGFLPINLGTGKGTSVLELVNAFTDVSDQTVPYVFTERRTGNIASCYTNATRAKKLLDWEAKLSVEDMCADTWR